MKPKKQRFSKFHQCDLVSVEDEDLLPVPSPYAPIFYRCLHRLRTSYTIDKNNESLQFFRSHAAFLKEKVRHLTTKDYKYVIHPLSNYAQRHFLFMTIMWTIALTLPPVVGSFYAVYMFGGSMDQNLGVIIFKCVKAIFNLTMLIDICIRFRLGYIISQTREIVLDPKLIVRHYLKTFFAFEIIASAVLLFIDIFDTFLGYRAKIILYQFYILRIVRIKLVARGLTTILKMCRLRKSVAEATVICLSWVFFVHYWTCMLKFINVIRDEYTIDRRDDWTSALNVFRRQMQKGDLESAIIHTSDLPKHLEYLHYFSIVLCHFFGAGVGHFRTENAFDMSMFSLLLFASLIIYLISIALLLQTFGMVNMSESRFDEILRQAQDYMVTKQFPSRLRRRICKYYDYKFDKKYFSEAKILSSLSEHLQMEILLYSCRNMVEKVNLFKGLSKAAVGCILALLKQEIYLPNDVIMRADDESGTLYFILFGTCGVMLLSGKEAMHIEDGSHFGENREFAKNVKHDFLYMVVALEACEVYSLSKKDIHYCCKHYPEVAAKIETMLVNKSKYYSNVLAQAATDDDTISVSDILEELRRGRILEHGRRRVQMDRILEI